MKLLYNSVNYWLVIISILRDKVERSSRYYTKFTFLSDSRSDLEKLIRKVIEVVSAYFYRGRFLRDAADIGPMRLPRPGDGYLNGHRYQSDDVTVFLSAALYSDEN